MNKVKTTALAVHDYRKKDLIGWVSLYALKLLQHKLVCSGTTGKLVEEVLRNFDPDKAKEITKIKKLKSGPLGGDQQMGALIAEGKIDIMVFLDLMQPQPYEVDVRALLRIAVLYNIPIANNR
ncbi:MAG: methylglyoxal synthase [Sphingobacteriaceae bacterium]